MLHDAGAQRSYLYKNPINYVCALGPGAAEEARALVSDARRQGAFAAGLFAYEWGAAVDAAPRAPGGAWPDIALGLYPGRIVFDHAQQTSWREGDAPALADGPRLDASAAPALVRPASTRAEVLARVANVLARIRAGDLYQANISQAFIAELAGDDAPEKIFARLSRASASDFAGYFALDEARAVVTNSPELFLRLSADGEVETKPIKGTRPRGRTPDEDAALADELRASEKDRAENLMIVDLMRNDLSRVCARASVETPRLFELESYANVHHLVSTVTGQLADGVDVVDLLGACFPPGSITGAPKLQAMKMITANEEEARGPYCGALGHIAPDGSAAFNVMIRSIDFGRDDAGAWRGVFRAGGGIVADSDPLAEHHEMLDKASAIAAALGARLDAHR